MRRYPHTAVIEIRTETYDGSGIPHIDTREVELIGRYEPAGQNRNLDQSAKFFCPKLQVIDPNALSGQRMKINGGWIGISQAWNYQNHCELWLD